MKLYQHIKNQFISFIFPWHTVNFRVLKTEWPHLFLTTPTPLFFNQLPFSMNMYQHAKNQVFSSFFSRDIVNLKILQCDWLRTFWFISQEPDFSQVWNLCKNTANIIKFLYSPNSEKFITKFSNKFKKPCFRPIFGLFSPFFGQKKFS